MRSEIIIDWAVQTGLSVTLLVVFILLIRRPFAKRFGAKAAYALWLLPVLRLFIPTITVPRVFPETTVTGLPEVTAVLPPIVTPQMIDEATRSSWPDHLLPMALGLWVIGAVGFFLCHWLRQAAFMDEALSNSQPAQGLKSVIESAASRVGLNQIPQVKISDDNRGPFVSGLFRPIVILPNDFTQSFSAQQQSYALIHEFMHIKRGDLFMTGLGFAFRSLNWPNPIIHYAAKHFRSDQEAACDASALKVMGGGTHTLSEYAETLVHAAKVAVQKKPISGPVRLQPSALTLTIHHPLKERLMILGTHANKSSWRSRAVATVLILGAATLSAPLIKADAHPEEELAGKYETHTGKSVIKRDNKKNGKTVSGHFEITVDGDDVKAFKVGPLGQKTPIDLADIEGADFEYKSFAKSPKPPSLQGLFKKRENIFIFDEDGFEGIESLKALDFLKDLEGLEKLEALEGLENLEKFGTLKNLNHPDGTMKLKILMTESRLAAARALLEDTEVLAGDTREMVKAKHALEKVRKALKAAGRALEEVE